MRVLTSANEELFKKMKEDGATASALMELMKPEVEKYAQEYADNEKEYSGIPCNLWNALIFMLSM